MSELAFAELQTQVELLPFYQIVLLKDRIDRIVAKKKPESPNPDLSLYILYAIFFIFFVKICLYRKDYP